jgi:hypothetical protein
MKKVILYGIGNANEMYRVHRYEIFDEGIGSISEMIHTAFMMQARNPSIIHVYAIDDYYGLYRDYREAVKMNNVVGWIGFKDMLERQGLMII